MINSGIANRRQPFAGAVVPGELNLAYARVIGQDSILGRLRVYLLGHHRRHLTRQPELGSVEWLVGRLGPGTGFAWSPASLCKFRSWRDRQYEGLT